MRSARIATVSVLLLCAVVIFVRWELGVHSPTGGASKERHVAPLERSPEEAQAAEALARARGAELRTEATPLDHGVKETPIPPVSPPESFVVRAVDEAGQAVSGVAVFLVRTRDWQNIGTTDAAGEIRAEVSLLPSEGCEIVGQVHDYAQARQWASPGNEQGFTLRMLESGTLAGRVTLPDGTALPGATLAAVDSRIILSSLTATLRMIEGDPTATISASNDSGEFSIDSLSPACSYRIYAGTNGYVLLGRRDAYTPTRTDLNFVAAPLFGFSVDLREPDGSSVQVSANMILDCNAWYAGTEERPTPVGASGAIMAGVPPESVRADPGHYYFFYTSPKGLPTADLGPFDFSATIPGYSPARVQAWATPISDGIAKYSSIVIRETDCRGDLDVEFYGLPSNPSEHSRSIGFATLTLQPREGGTAIPLQMSDDRVRRIYAIPCGTYQARMQSSKGFFYWPFAQSDSAEVVIKDGANPPASLRIDLGRCGAVEIMPILGDGTVWDGALGVELHPERPFSEVLQTVWFDRPPYWLNGLYVGMQQDEVEYSITAYIPTMQEDAAVLAGVGIARVAPGESTQLRVELR